MYLHVLNCIPMTLIRCLGPCRRPILFVVLAVVDVNSSPTLHSTRATMRWWSYAHPPSLPMN